MDLNNNTQIYEKFSFWISILFCLFFIVVANIMRFNFLSTHNLTVVKTKAEPPQYHHFVTFHSLKEKNMPLKMLFLKSELNQKYLLTAFSKIDPKEYTNILIYNCGLATDLNTLQNFLYTRFDNTTQVLDSCNFVQETLEEKLKEEQTLSILILKENFKNKKALRAAERAALRPDIHIMEIKHANTRL